MASPDRELAAIASARWRVAGPLLAATMLIYFGFVFLVAFNKSFMASQIAPGLSWGILLGAIVIVVAWALTGAYVNWANTTYDTRVRSYRADEEGRV